MDNGIAANLLYFRGLFSSEPPEVSAVSAVLLAGGVYRCFKLELIIAYEWEEPNSFRLCSV